MFDFSQSSFWTLQNGFFGLLTGLAMFLISSAVAVGLLLRIPEDYFLDANMITSSHRSNRPHWLIIAARNALAIPVIILGIILSLPGVPGPGLVTILLGIMLLVFPGKRRLEQRLVRIKSVRNTINRVRARFGKPPLRMDEPNNESKND